MDPGEPESREEEEEREEPMTGVEAEHDEPELSSRCLLESYPQKFALVSIGGKAAASIEARAAGE